MDRDPCAAKSDDVVLRRVTGVGQQALRQDLQAILDLLHHRDSQAGVIAPARGCHAELPVSGFTAS